MHVLDMTFVVGICNSYVNQFVHWQRTFRESILRTFRESLFWDPRSDERKMGVGGFSLKDQVNIRDRVYQNYVIQ